MRIVIRILLWSLFVGLVLTWLGWTPGELLAHLPRWLMSIFDWAWPYVRQGAVIVVPVAVIMLVLGAARRRRNDRAE